MNSRGAGGCWTSVDIVCWYGRRGVVWVALVDGMRTLMVGCRVGSGTGWPGVGALGELPELVNLRALFDLELELWRTAFD